MLRPGIQYTPVLPRLAVQLQVPMVLLRQMQHLQREDRGVHVQMRVFIGRRVFASMRVCARLCVCVWTLRVVSVCVFVDKV